MIKTKHLSKYFGSLRAVDDVSFEIVGGECIGLLGLNGAGKTTLLRMLTSQLAPTAGSATIDGLDVASGDLAVRRRLGFLPEVPPLYGEMRVVRFLDFAARLREVPAAEVAGRVERAVERCQLQAVIEQRIATLSYGYKKRVGIAQAIVHQPPLVVLDEPIAGLDPAQIVEMRDLIRHLRGPHTVLLSSHILSEISQTCDRILVMHRGRIAAQGSEEELLGSLAQKRRLLLRIEGDGALAAELLGGLDGVESVEPGPEDGRGAALLLTTSTDVRTAAARKVIEAGLGLLELAEQRDDLESVFLRLTGSREVES